MSSFDEEVVNNPDSDSDTDDSVDSTSSSSQQFSELSPTTISSIKKSFDMTSTTHPFSLPTRTFSIPNTTRTFTLKQNYTNCEETGGAIYDSSLTLLDYILSPPNSSPREELTFGNGGGHTFLSPQLLNNRTLKAKILLSKKMTVLEIGSGPGLVATTLALAGASVIATDGGDDVILLLKENLRLNKLEEKVVVRNIKWGNVDEIEQLLPFIKTEETLVLLSDIVSIYY